MAPPSVFRTARKPAVVAGSKRSGRIQQIVLKACAKTRTALSNGRGDAGDLELRGKEISQRRRMLQRAGQPAKRPFPSLPCSRW